MDLTKICSLWDFVLVLLLHIISALDEKNDGVSKGQQRDVRERRLLMFTSHADRKDFASENIDKVQSHHNILRRLIRRMIRKNACHEETTADVVNILSEGRSNTSSVQREMVKVRQRLGNTTIMCKVKHKRRRRTWLRSRLITSKESTPDHTGSRNIRAKNKKDIFTCSDDISQFNLTNLTLIEEDMKKDKCWNSTDLNIVSRLRHLLTPERKRYRGQQMQMMRLKCKLLKRYHSCQKVEKTRTATPKPRNPIQEEFWSNFGYTGLDEDDELGDLGLLFY